MHTISEHVERIRTVSEAVGAAELARQAGVPYTTVVDWKAREYRPRSVDIFEQLAIAADTLIAQRAESDRVTLPSDLMPSASQIDGSQNTEICAAECRRATGETGGAL